MHRDEYEYEEDESRKELAYLSAESDYLYHQWLEEESKRIKAIFKVETKYEQVQDKDSYLQER